MTQSRLDAQREQDKQRRLGSWGAASKVRLVDPASVDTAALIEQIKNAQERSERRLLYYAARGGLPKR
jgi:hypothetical protein